MPESAGHVIEQPGGDTFALRCFNCGEAWTLADRAERNDAQRGQEFTCPSCGTAAPATQEEE